MKTASGFHGVYPMIYALFDEAGKLSRTAMRRQVQSMIEHKVHGIAVLGLATEVNKLSSAERLQVVEWAAEDVAGRVPLAVTVAELSAAGQAEFVKSAVSLGVKWAILQPPQVKGVPETELIRFFGAVAEKSPIPLGIQNAPEYLGVGLSNQGIKALNRAHANVCIIKLEATALAVAALNEEVQGAMDIFNGRGGIELNDSIRAGAVGIIPGGETFDVLTRIFDDVTSGDAAREAKAERAYGEILPLLVVLMASMDTFLTYGKILFGHRLGISEILPRMPGTPASDFGRRLMKRYADQLGKL